MAFEFSLASKLKSDLKITNLHYFRKIALGDSISKIFPTGDIYIKDPVGLFSEVTGYVEGEEHEIIYGDDEDTSEQLVFPCVKTDQRLIDFYHEGCMAGDVFLQFRNKNIIKDIAQSRSFSSMISSIVDDVSDDFDFESTAIESTDNQGVYGQGLIKNTDFLIRLMKKANSTLHTGEPYFCFIDLANKFHFETMSNMLLNSPVLTIVLKQTDASKYDTTTLVNCNVYWDNFKKNFNNYMATYYYIDNDGEIQSEDKKINETPTRSKGKLPILSNIISDPISHRFFGFVDEDKLNTENLPPSKKDYSGWVSSWYQESQGIMIFDAVLRGCHPKAIAGQTVKTTIPSLFDDRGDAVEFSGTWVILESKHLIDENLNIFTELILGRNYIDVYNTNPYLSDLL